MTAAERSFSKLKIISCCQKKLVSLSTLLFKNEDAKSILMTYWIDLEKNEPEKS